jgi:hypothetical protein
MEIAGDLVVKAQDWPGAEELSERMRKVIPPHLLSEKERAEMPEQGPDAAAMQQQMGQAEEMMQMMQENLQKLQQENDSLKRREAIELQKLEIEKQGMVLEEFRAETERIKVYGDLQLKGAANEAQLVTQQMAAEEAEKDREIDLIKTASAENQSREQAQRDAEAQAQSAAQASTPPAE